MVTGPGHLAEVMDVKSSRDPKHFGVYGVRGGNFFFFSESPGLLGR